MMITRTPGFYCISLFVGSPVFIYFSLTSSYRPLSLFLVSLRYRPTLCVCVCVYTWMLSRSSSCLIGYTLAIDRRIYSSFSIVVVLFLHTHRGILCVRSTNLRNRIPNVSTELILSAAVSLYDMQIY